MIWNLLVIGLYLLGIVLFGIFMTKFVKKSSDFFLGGRVLNHWVVAGTVIGTNVAAIYLVGPAGVAYKSGVSVLMIAWTGNMLAAFSAALFVPRLRRLQLTTVPDLLEARYNYAVRLLPVVLWLVYYAFFTGNNIYALAVCLSAVLDWPVDRLIWVIGPIVVLYCTVSGLLGAAYTDVLQTFLMVIGGVVLLPLAMKEVGGFDVFVEKMPVEMFTFWKSGSDGINWQDLVMFTLTGFPFWCTSQYLLQRTFAAKSVKDASLGLTLAAVLTGPLTLCYILPGMCGKLLYAGNETLAKTPDLILPYMFKEIIPVGLGGVFIAALIAASYSTVAAMLNASATLFTNDVYQHFRKNETERHYTWVARVVTIIVGLIAIVFAFFVPRLGGIIQANYEIMTFFEPPIFVVVCGALFWRKITNTGAVVTLIGGTLVNVVCTWGFHLGPAERSMLIFPVCFLLLFQGSLFGRPNSAKKQEAVDRFMERLNPGQMDFSSWRFKIGLLIAEFSLLGFVLCSVYEDHLPKPGNVFIFLGLVTTFILGVLVLLPCVTGREVQEENTNEALSRSLVNRILGFGWLWLAVYAAAGALMAVLYFL